MITIHVDASTKGNPGPSGGGFVLSGDGVHIQQAFALTGELSNHEAEFAALLSTLEYVIDHELHSRTVMIYTDSKILAQTVTKNYARHPEYQKYLQEINEKLQMFSLIFIEWIPESKNKGADHMARQGLQKVLKQHKKRGCDKSR